MGKLDACIPLENLMNTSKHYKQLEIIYKTLRKHNFLQWFLTVSNLEILRFFTCVGTSSWWLYGAFGTTLPESLSITIYASMTIWKI